MRAHMHTYLSIYLRSIYIYLFENYPWCMCQTAPKKKVKKPKPVSKTRIEYLLMIGLSDIKCACIGDLQK